MVMEINTGSEIIQVGALVDSVHEVLEIDDKEVLSPPNLGAKYKSSFIYGIVKYAERFIMLLDMDLVFSADDLEMLSNQIKEITNSKEIAEIDSK